MSFGPAMFVAVVGSGACGCSLLAVFVKDFEFLFLFFFSLFLRFLDLEFVGDLVIVTIVCGG